MSELCAIGLMSGTSMDGIDLAVLRTDGENAVERGPSFFVPYEAAFRRRIEAGLEDAKRIDKRDERPGDLAALERNITLRHAEAVATFRAKLRDDARWGRSDLIGFHGQTVLHRPHVGLTVQLGDGPLLAGKTGLPVVYDMRANDMVHGGQGAPLVPAYHAALARALPAVASFPVVFVNIGGISNITFVPEKGDPVAFDTGPGNALIDRWVQREGGVPFDAGGAIASEGGVSRPVVERYLEKSFFKLPGPKSLDRNDFTLAEAEDLALADGARTLAAVSAEAILKSVKHLPQSPKLWIVCGGGRKNPHIVGDLREGAARLGAEVMLAEDAGLDGDATEAEAWAYLAVRALKGLPLTFPATTGCREAVSGGVIARADGLPGRSA
ncbi:anhydro-N-acetylmuramic acid kinase [Ollibium composti]|uniref:Anhydro-N-acetylmuramic acid kinase n=1 Tax=Ollibium composti TaxID=2675109 RepID=A0ABY2Q1M6_9HYPH|nr:anhydro-N-acetylmuramic acid kinase [Mesorhizobium composti]THF54748.1 anhydro-N-acetylmuramic acid kinase [Mesorhizobium composti]